MSSSRSPVTASVDQDGVGWIVVDDPVRRSNVLDGETRAALSDALDSVARGEAKAAVIVSGKDRIFLAGADLKELRQLPDAASATAFSQDGQRVFQRIADAPFPVVCAIHGTCAGGGYEVALACHWRMASDAPVTQVGLPEIGLGTIPGWGACVRLPRLIGAQAALDHLLKARLVIANAALRAGLVDAVVPTSDLRARAKSAALELAKNGKPARQALAWPPPEFFVEQRRKIFAQTHGHLPAPAAVIDVISSGAGSDQPSAYETEARTFGELTVSAVCRNQVRAFFLREAAKKRTLEGWYPSAVATPSRIEKVAVMGAGVMGSGIAQLLAAHGFTVVLRDMSSENLERGMRVIRGLFDEGVTRGKLLASAASAGMARISATTTWEGIASCDAVIEAVVEDVRTKQALFGELEKIVRADTVLASNTSALPIEEIAVNVSRPDRTLGLHFFNPVSRMALVELNLARATSAASAESALALVKACGKTPIICRSSPGFLVTRVLFFYLNEAVRLWERGMPAGVIDAALREYGWPMGPLRLIDEVGIDVTDFIFTEMAHYFLGRFDRTAACASLLKAGLLGRKNGAGSGIYLYENGREALNPAASAVIGGGGEGAAPASVIVGKLMGTMAAEARRCLDEGVVRSSDDIDFALIAGAGYPAFRGELIRLTS